MYPPPLISNYFVLLKQLHDPMSHLYTYSCCPLIQSSGNAMTIQYNVLNEGIGFITLGHVMPSRTRCAQLTDLSSLTHLSDNHQWSVGYCLVRLLSSLSPMCQVVNMLYGQLNKGITLLYITQVVFSSPVCKQCIGIRYGFVLSLQGWSFPRRAWLVYWELCGYVRAE